MKPASLSPEAVQELAEAASWYETRQPGLAIRFLLEIDQARHAIQSRPRTFPRLANTSVDLEIRRALLPRFPYTLVFLELQTEIRVLAIAHAKRHPTIGSIAYRLPDAYPALFMNVSAVTRFSNARRGRSLSPHP